jgi:hypothetical protein
MTRTDATATGCVGSMFPLDEYIATPPRHCHFPRPFSRSGRQFSIPDGEHDRQWSSCFAACDKKSIYSLCPNLLSPEPPTTATSSAWDGALRENSRSSVVFHGRQDGRTPFVRLCRLPHLPSRSSSRLPPRQRAPLDQRINEAVIIASRMVCDLRRISVALLALNDDVVGPATNESAVAARR